MMVYLDDVDAAFQQAVDAGAKVVMPVQNHFYGDRSGMVEDPFGHHWSLATHVKDVAPEEAKRRVHEMMGGLAKMMSQGPAYRVPPAPRRSSPTSLRTYRGRESSRLTPPAAFACLLVGCAI